MMIDPRRRVPPGVTERLRAHAERPLSPEEAEAIMAVPMSAEEETELRGLIRWFVTRYPTPAARLAYARHAAEQILRPSSEGEQTAGKRDVARPVRRRPVGAARTGPHRRRR